MMDLEKLAVLNKWWPTSSSSRGDVAQQTESPTDTQSTAHWLVQPLPPSECCRSLAYAAGATIDSLMLYFAVRSIFSQESFARSLYRDGSHEFLTSDLVVETLATDPKRGNIHLFACLSDKSTTRLLWLTGCLWVTTPASIVQKLTSVRVTTVQVHDVAWKSQSACPCIRNYGCIQRGG